MYIFTKFEKTVWKKVDIFLMRKDIHIVNQKSKKGICHVLILILCSIWVHTESPKYKLICIKSPKSSWFAIFSQKLWPRIFNYVNFSILKKYRNKKLSLSVGLQPALPMFGVIWTAAQYDAQKKLPKNVFNMHAIHFMRLGQGYHSYGPFSKFLHILISCSTQAVKALAACII